MGERVILKSLGIAVALVVGGTVIAGVCATLYTPVNYRLGLSHEITTDMMAQRGVGGHFFYAGGSRTFAKGFPVTDTSIRSYDGKWCYIPVDKVTFAGPLPDMKLYILVDCQRDIANIRE